MNKDFLTPVKETPYAYTQPSQYFKGDLNPVEKRLVTRGVCIDTLFRPNYEGSSSTDFMYDFPENYKNIVSMKVTAIEIPIVWYAFSCERKNNFFTIPTLSKTIQIPDGNYKSDEMITTLFTALDGTNIRFTIDTPSTKCIFRSDSAFELSFAVESMELYQTMGWNLGFRKESYTATNIDGIWTIISESSYGSAFDNYFFLEIDDFQRNCITDSIISVIKPNKGYIGRNIIARIPISTSYNIINSSNDSDRLFKTREYLGPVRLEKLRIRLLNRFGEVISLNQNDYSIMIEFVQLFS